MINPLPFALIPFIVLMSVNSIADDIKRPRYELDLSQPYSTDGVTAYAEDHSEIYAHVDANIGQHTANLQRWLRQPSISAQNVGIREMAAMVRDDLKAIGFQEANLVETKGHPGVWGYYDAGAPKTLMVYLMYDVQPVNPDDWQSPPFAADIVDVPVGKAIMARGAANQKGPERAFLNALESIIAVKGSLPVNIMVTAEGEEELGSPNYAQIVDQYEDRLRTADGVIFPMPGQNENGHTNVVLGVKGIVYWELEARGGSWGGPAKAEIHGSFKAITDSPVLRLIQAISTLVSDDGNTILVPGYYDDVRPPTAEEQSLMAGFLASNDGTQLKQVMGVERWMDNMSGEDLLHDLIYSPTMNVDGLWAGYTGEGVKTILPHVATAKMDSRLPLGINSDEALSKIRRHLDAGGFSDIKMTIKSNYPASQTSVSAAIVQAAISVYKKYGPPPTVNPRLAGSAPFYQFTERLKLPMIPIGLGHGRGAHAPNEYYVVQSDGDVAGLAEIEKAYVDLLYALSEQ
jgi:acetylornithine deacetylase/succinyl-diaminopimelate desuccinylase-like protein